MNQSVSLEDGIKGYEPTRAQVRNRLDQLAAYVKMEAAGTVGAAQSGSAETQEAASKKKVPSHFDVATNLIFKHEGRRMVPNDNGKGPARYGILQSTLKELDPEARIADSVTELDDGKAKQIYRKIWYRAGCDKLDYPLNIIHFDTFMHRPNMAIATLDNSDGDPQTYLELRQTALRGLRGYKKFAASWEGRIRNLTKLLVPGGQAAGKKADRPQVLEQGEAG